MLKAVKIFRRIFRFFAYGAGVFALAQLLWLVYLFMAQDGWNAGALAVKMLINGVLWFSFQSLASGLGALECTLINRQKRLGAQISFEYGVGPRQVNKEKALAAIVVCAAIGLLVWLYNENARTGQKTAIASGCTSTYTAMILHFPTLQGYSLAEVADAFIRDVPPENLDQQRQSFIQELQECRWYKVLALAGETLYIEPSRMLLIPNNRRAIPVLYDYYSKRSLITGNEDKEYKSIVAMLLVGCDHLGTLYLAQRRYSAWFATGTVIPFTGGSGLGMSEVAIAPLQPTEKGSIGRSLAEAICSIE